MFRQRSIEAFVAGAAVMALLTPCASSGQTTGAPKAADRAAIAAQVQAAIDAALARPEAVGLSVAVGRGGVMLVEQGAGLADIEHDAPTGVDTLFRIGSLTKMFTAAAVVRLTEQGKLSLEDDIGARLPNAPTQGRAVTIRQMLTHTSGLPNITSQPEFRRSAAREMSADELMAIVQGAPFEFEPGERWKYSNTNYLLFGPMIEAVDGRPFAQFLQEEFFGPLGLMHTRHDSEREIVHHRAQGYDFDPGVGVLNDPLIAMHNSGAGGGLLSTAGDLVRWSLALTSGRAVQPASYRQMVDSAVPTGVPGMSYGFGLAVFDQHGRARISHFGAINGFTAVLSWYPADDLHIAVISNSTAVTSDALEIEIATAILSPDVAP
jgi:CubicO group peptidase (beta-lactamase class C family)